MRPVRNAIDSDTDRAFGRIVTGGTVVIFICSKRLRFARLIYRAYRALFERP
jgi:hypothetical protein